MFLKCEVNHLEKQTNKKKRSHQDSIQTKFLEYKTFTMWGGSDKSQYQCPWQSLGILFWMCYSWMSTKLLLSLMINVIDQSKNFTSNSKIPMPLAITLNDDSNSGLIHCGCCKAVCTRVVLQRIFVKGLQVYSFQIQGLGRVLYFSHERQIVTTRWSAVVKVI